MLDKSVPFVDIIMRRDPGQPLREPELLSGCRFVMYQAGDEADWARIETSVDEFKKEADAINYFKKEFLSCEKELPRRCMFIETESGEKIATATAWWAYTGKRRDPTAHWVAVMPGYQGKGFGKAIIAELVRLMVEIEGDRTFYLHTQTWSHRAVRIYEWAGFVISDEPDIIGCANGRYGEAIEILKDIAIQRKK